MRQEVDILVMRRQLVKIHQVALAVRVCLDTVATEHPVEVMFFLVFVQNLSGIARMP